MFLRATEDDMDQLDPREPKDSQLVYYTIDNNIDRKYKKNKKLFLFYFLLSPLPLLF